MPIQDAFSAGVEPGGLYTSQEIKILICYMLLGVGEPMERQMVTELIAGNGMANFFETAAAVDELARQGHLTEKEGRISLTETGRQVGDTLAGMIPYTLRERSVKAALQLLTRIRREQENTVELEKLDHGYRVTCTIQDSASHVRFPAGGGRHAGGAYPGKFSGRSHPALPQPAGHSDRGRGDATGGHGNRHPAEIGRNGPGIRKKAEEPNRLLRFLVIR